MTVVYLTKNNFGGVRTPPYICKTIKKHTDIMIKTKKYTMNSITGETPNNVIKVITSKCYNCSQNQVKVFRQQNTENFDKFTTIIGSLFLKTYDDLKGHSIMDFVSSTQTAKGAIVRLSEMRELSTKDFSIQMMCNSDGVEIFKIEVFKQGKGIGTELMEKMVEVSECLNIPLYLKPTPYKNTTADQLRKFYHKLGFSRSTKSQYWTNF